jgi:hypothetical protein
MCRRADAELSEEDDSSSGNGIIEGIKQKAAEAKVRYYYLLLYQINAVLYYFKL